MCFNQRTWCWMLNILMYVQILITVCWCRKSSFIYCNFLALGMIANLRCVLYAGMLRRKVVKGRELPNFILNLYVVLFVNKSNKKSECVFFRCRINFCRTCLVMRRRTSESLSSVHGKAFKPVQCHVTLKKWDKLSYFIPLIMGSTKSGVR